MLIREMRPEDVSQAAQIEADAFSMPWSAASFSDALSREDTLYIAAEENGEILGYCGLWQSLDEGEIPNMAVKKEFRGRGVGEALLRELIRRGEERGITAFTLEARASNAAALALYEKIGFRSAGIRPRFYEKPTEDAVIMWKR